MFLVKSCFIKKCSLPNLCWQRWLTVVWRPRYISMLATVFLKLFTPPNIRLSKYNHHGRHSDIVMSAFRVKLTILQRLLPISAGAVAISAAPRVTTSTHTWYTVVHLNFNCFEIFSSCSALVLSWSHICSVLNFSFYLLSCDHSLILAWS